MAPTIDQMIAEKIGGDSVLPSLEVSSETTTQSAACGSGACYYSSTLSFRNATTPLPMEFNPRKVFTQLFGAGDTPEERAMLAQRRASVLDMIGARTRRLEARARPRATSRCSTTTSSPCARPSGASRRRRSAISPASTCPTRRSASCPTSTSK